MAINQVIHGSNRVVENPNRYKLNAVSGQANTYDLEKMPGVITDNGTPYNKIILDKLDNVLSYLTPSVEKVGHQAEVEGGNVFATYSGTATSYSNNTDFSYATQNFADGTTLTLKGNFQGSRGTSGTISTGNNNLVLSQTNSTAVTSNYIRLNKPTNYIELDLGTQKTFELGYYVSGAGSKLKLYSSNDETIWDLEKTFTSNEKNTIQILNKRYVKITPDDTSYNQDIYTFYINKYNYISTTYQNQFTLDNNGTEFQNNQRLLVETPKNIGYQEKTLTQNIFAEDITPNWNSTGTISSILSGNLTSFNNITPSYEYLTTPTTTFNANSFYASDIETGIASLYDSSATYSSDNFLYNEKLTSNTSGYYNRFWLYKGKEITLSKIFDMKINCKVTFKCRMTFNYINGVKIYASNDKNNWEELKTISSATIETYESTQYYRYYKFDFISDGSFEYTGEIGIQFLYISQIKYLEESEIPYDVSSNTLNGIDIPILLQPSTKYELIYKEDTNKFELGKLSDNSIVDITLSESVSEILLTGISEKLEENKLYQILINGSQGTTGASIYMVDTDIGWLGTTQTSCFALFTIHEILGNKYMTRICFNSSGSSTGKFEIGTTALNTNEKIYTSNRTFNAGTRIIIKEVA